MFELPQLVTFAQEVSMVTLDGMKPMSEGFLVKCEHVIHQLADVFAAVSFWA